MSRPSAVWYIDEDKCLEFGLDPKRVRSIARRISTASKEAHSLGLKVFGGSGHGSLRLFGGGCQNDVAFLGGNFDGGDLEATHAE